MGGAKREGKLPIPDGRDCLLVDDSKKAAGAGSSLKTKKPQRGNAEASGNVISLEKDHMANNSTAVSNVIPFDFYGRKVRTLTIEGEPWFVATDACKILGVINTTQAMQALDDDERSMFNIGRQGQVNIINESGLYTLILRCRDAVTKGSKAHAFRRWVTSEVLPAIRKNGRHVDSTGKMAELVDEAIGRPGAQVIGSVIRCRVSKISSEAQRSAVMKLSSALHARFSVPRIEDIPSSQMDSACNFIAGYAIEGEYLPRQEEAGIYLDKFEASHLYLLMSRFSTMFKHKDVMLTASRALESAPLLSIFSQLHDGNSSFCMLDKRRDELYQSYTAIGCEGGYAMRKSA